MKINSQVAYNNNSLTKKKIGKTTLYCDFAYYNYANKYFIRDCYCLIQKQKKIFKLLKQ